MRSTPSRLLCLGLLALVVGCSSDPEPAPAPPEHEAEERSGAERDAAPVSTSTVTPPAAPAGAVDASAPTAGGASAADEAKEHSRLGMQHLSDGLHQEAEQAFSRAIELTPQDAFPHAARALARNHMGQSEAAVADVSRAIELANRDDGFVLDLYAFRGSVQTELQRWAEGEADLTRCVDRGKDEVELRLSRGTCLLELGQLDRALADADSAVARAPDADALGRGLWLRGLVHERAGRLEPAAADLEASVQAGNTACLDDLTRVRAALGR